MQPSAMTTFQSTQEPSTYQEIREDGFFDASIDTLLRTLSNIWASAVERLPMIVIAIGVVIVTYLVARFGSSLLERVLDKRDMRRSMQDLVLRFALTGIWIFGLMVAAMVLFPNLTPTKALGVLGIGSVAVGFAFKDVFENFLAGVMILWRFPFDIGDTIACEGIVGRVERITIRNTIVRKPTDELVVLPNATLFKNPVDVLTEEPQRRIAILTGVSYDTDVDAALPLIEQAVEGCETVSKDRGVQVFPQAFGASSVDIEVAWWADSSLLGERRSRGEVVAAIKRALDENGIEIPFPYRTLTFKEPLPLQRDRGSTDAEVREGADAPAPSSAG